MAKEKDIFKPFDWFGSGDSGSIILPEEYYVGDVESALSLTGNALKETGFTMLKSAIKVVDIPRIVITNTIGNLFQSIGSLMEGDAEGFLLNLS